MSEAYKELKKAMDVPPNMSFREEMFIMLMNIYKSKDEIFKLNGMRHVLRKLYGEREGSLMKETGEILNKVNKRIKALMDMHNTSGQLIGLLQNRPEVYSHDKQNSH